MRKFIGCSISFLTSLSLAAVALSVHGAEENRYRVDWSFALEAGVDLADVTLEIADGRPVHEIRFDFDPDVFSNFDASGELTIDAGSATWEPPSEDAVLTYQVKISRERRSQNQEQSFDALMTDTWALFRGDRITPRMSVTTRKGAEAESLLHIDVPAGWTVNTGWPLHDGNEDGDSVYRIDDPERSFDRPTGWIMVGKLGTRRAYVGDTYFSIAAPLNSGTDRMTWLTLVSLVYPELEKAFVKVPPKILMVSGDDPLWRGGLSGPNSFFFHSSRRAVSENGTSPLFHELTHVVTRISGDDDDDWIAEGLAEYYGIELMRRAGGLTSEKKAEILKDLANWGEDAPKLRRSQSTGAVTARAVGVFAALDQEIAKATDGDENLDAVTRLLMEKRRVSLADLRDAFEKVVGESSTTLNSVE
jgi:hypothetical protein